MTDLEAALAATRGALQLIGKELKEIQTARYASPDIHDTHARLERLSTILDNLDGTLADFTPPPPDEVYIALRFLLAGRESEDVIGVFTADQKMRAEQAVLHASERARLFFVKMKLNDLEGFEKNLPSNRAGQHSGNRTRSFSEDRAEGLVDCPTVENALSVFKTWDLVDEAKARLKQKLRVTPRLSEKFVFLYKTFPKGATCPRCSADEHSHVCPLCKGNGRLREEKELPVMQMGFQQWFCLDQILQGSSAILNAVVNPPTHDAPGFNPTPTAEGLDTTSRFRPNTEKTREEILGPSAVGRAKLAQQSPAPGEPGHREYSGVPKPKEPLFPEIDEDVKHDVEQTALAVGKSFLNIHSLTIQPKPSVVRVSRDGPTTGVVLEVKVPDGRKDVALRFSRKAASRIREVLGVVLEEIDANPIT